MRQMQRTDIEPIRALLRQVLRRKATDFDGLLSQLAPVLELDKEEDRIIFQTTIGNPNVIRIGVKCTVRLQAHAYASGIIIAALSTPGFNELSDSDRQELLSPADGFLTWAVGRDLQTWLRRREGFDTDLDKILAGAGTELPESLLTSLSRKQRIFGEGLFRIACAWIILHEIGHLHSGHVACREYESISQEKEADRFATDWLLDGASSSQNAESSRINALFGIAVALTWLTVFNVFLGQMESVTHPQGYDRLFQVLDHAIDPQNKVEHAMVWFFVDQMLLIHMWSAGFNSTQDAKHVYEDPRDHVNDLIDRISKQQRL
jgi:Peptidase U49